MHEAPFTNWTTAATNIQDAINDNMPGGVVLVHDGLYNQGGGRYSILYHNLATMTCCACRVRWTATTVAPRISILVRTNMFIRSQIPMMTG